MVKRMIKWVLAFVVALVAAYAVGEYFNGDIILYFLIAVYYLIFFCLEGKKAPKEAVLELEEEVVEEVKKIDAGEIVAEYNELVMKLRKVKADLKQEVKKTCAELKVEVKKVKDITEITLKKVTADLSREVKKTTGEVYDEVTRINNASRAAALHTLALKTEIFKEGSDKPNRIFLHGFANGHPILSDIKSKEGVEDIIYVRKDIGDKNSDLLKTRIKNLKAEIAILVLATKRKK